MHSRVQAWDRKCCGYHVLPGVIQLWCRAGACSPNPASPAGFAVSLDVEIAAGGHLFAILQ